MPDERFSELAAELSTLSVEARQRFAADARERARQHARDAEIRTALYEELGDARYREEADELAVAAAALTDVAEILERGTDETPV